MSLFTHMSHPEYIYYALMVLLVLPSILLNRLAVVMFVCWLPGQMLAHLSWIFPSFPTYSADVYAGVDAVMAAIGLAAGLIICLVYQGNTGNAAVTLLYFPLILTHGINWLESLGPAEFRSLSAYHAWWLVFWISVAQCLFIPLGNNWRPVFKVLHKWGLIKDPHMDFHFFKRLDDVFRL